MNLIDSDYDEIIAIQVNNNVYFGMAAIDAVIESQDFEVLHSRAVFKLMALLDLGPQWQEYSEYPIIFKLSELKNYENI